MNRVKFYLILICSLIIFSACSRWYYTPVSTIPFEAIPEFSSNKLINLVNLQSATEVVPISSRMEGNLREWADVAIIITARELKARGMHIDKDSPRSLGISIVHAQTEASAVKVETIIKMRVDAGNGYSSIYLGENNSVLFASTRQIDGAMMRVVKEMLKDPSIVSYLKE